jgi:hypothetical protein
MEGLAILFSFTNHSGDLSHRLQLSTASES